MSGQGGIAIFVKTPGRSAVKTRLASVLGETLAVEWHRRAAATVAAVARVAAAASGAVVYWAVAEADAIRAGAWPDLPNLDQGAGGLGARMGRVHAELVQRHGFGILLGADAPQLDERSLRQACGWLAGETARQALGPARDGGFWLYGGNRATAVTRWEQVGYSRTDTAEGFEVAFADRGGWLLLPTLTDVDHAADLAAMRSELAALADGLPEQQALGAWVASVAPAPPPGEATS